MPRRYALIVANGAYRDPKLSRLRTPGVDAERLAGVLRDPAIGDFEVDLSLDEPEHVLRRKIAAFFSGRDRDDLLLLHFSCHGLKDDSGQLYFAATDTEVAHLDATAVSAEFVGRQMTRSRSRKVLALLDCCYSGAFARGLRFRGGESVDLDDQLGGHGRVILTASSAMEYAFEGEELTGTGNPSVFTTAVVKGLETGEADRDQDHRIAVDELYEYVCEQVREITPDQRPNMLSHLEGELYVARSSYVAPVAAAELPAPLRGAIESPLAGVRAGAVTELEALAGGADAALAEGARQALRLLMDDDSRRVSAVARAALGDEPALAALGDEPAAAVAVSHPPEPAAGPAEPSSAPPRRGPVARRRELAGLLAVLPGALLVLISLTVSATDAFSDALVGVEVMSVLAALAAAALAILRALRPRAGGRPGLDRSIVALAAVPLGVAFGAEGLEDQLGSTFSEGLAALGAGLIGLGGLGGLGGLTREPAPAPRPRRGAHVVVLVAAVGLALTIAVPWLDGTGVAGEFGPLLAAMLGAAALAAAAGALAGLGVLKLPWARLPAIVPAAGVAAAAAALTILGWAGSGAITVDAGPWLALSTGLAIAVAGLLAARAGVTRRPIRRRT